MRNSIKGFISWAISTAVVYGLTILVLDWLLDGFNLDRTRVVVTGAFVFSLIPALAWPAIYAVAARLHPALFPLLTLGLNALLLLLVDQVLPAMDIDVAAEIDGFGTAVILAFGLTFVSTLIGTLFSFNDDRGYQWFVERPLRSLSRDVPATDEPGVLYLEIDGLAEPILREALAGGFLPTIRGWIERGSHVITPWETDLSSQTGASQAGILLGSNEGIPAFRWWDKAAGELMVTSKPASVRVLERQLDSGDGLLTGGGASRWNVFTGGADDCVATFSAIGAGKGGSTGSYLAFLSNPFVLSRTFAQFFADVARELVEARRQRWRNEQPRMHRSVKYAFVRAATTTLMQEASRFMLLADVHRGKPAVYATFFAYDEVAHHSGIRTRDAFKVLKRLDRVFASLERATASAPRPYHLVVLSDHGQSQGATFRQRYGVSLADHVSGLLATPATVFADSGVDERMANLEVTVSEAIRTDSRSMDLVRRALAGRTADGMVHLGDGRTPPPEVGSVPEAVVLASGNLGLISFPRIAHRLTFEELVAAHPNLINGLVQHPGIGFVVVESEQEGGLVIGERGMRYLRDGHVAGTDPLAGYPANAARHIARQNAFPNMPDILVMSMVDPVTGEVAAFEELVGSHGGLGGTQSQAFVLHPVCLPSGSQELIGTAALHRTLNSWRGVG